MALALHTFPERDELEEFLLFLSLHLILSKQEAAAPLSVSKWVQDLFHSPWLSISWHCCLPALLLAPGASIFLWHNEGLLCV